MLHHSYSLAVTLLLVALLLGANCVPAAGLTVLSSIYPVKNAALVGTNAFERNVFINTTLTMDAVQDITLSHRNYTLDLIVGITGNGAYSYRIGNDVTAGVCGTRAVLGDSPSATEAVYGPVVPPNGGVMYYAYSRTVSLRCHSTSSLSTYVDEVDTSASVYSSGGGILLSHGGHIPAMPCTAEVYVDCSDHFPAPAEPTLPIFRLLGESQRPDGLQDSNTIRRGVIDLSQYDVDIFLEVNQTALPGGAVEVSWRCAPIVHVNTVYPNLVFAVTFGYNAKLDTVSGYVDLVANLPAGGLADTFTIPGPTCNQIISASATLVSGSVVQVLTLADGTVGASGPSPTRTIIHHISIPMLCLDVGGAGNTIEDDRVLEFVASNANGGQLNLAVDSSYAPGSADVPYVFDSLIRFGPAEDDASYGVSSFDLEGDIQFVLETRNNTGMPEVGYQVFAAVYLDQCGLGDVSSSVNPNTLGVFTNNETYVPGDNNTLTPQSLMFTIPLTADACGETLAIAIFVREYDTNTNTTGTIVHRVVYRESVSYGLFDGGPTEITCINYLVPCDGAGGSTPPPPPGADGSAVCYYGQDPAATSAGLGTLIVVTIATLLFVLIVGHLIPIFTCGGESELETIREDAQDDLEDDY